MRGPILQLLASTFGLSIRVFGLSANRNLNIAGDWAPGNIPQIDPLDSNSLLWVDPATLGGGGSGTVTSVAVGVNAASVLDIANGDTTPTITFDNQSANTVFAGPSSGGAAAPTFRSLVAADIPSLPGSIISSGTIDTARLSVGSTGGTVAAGDDSRFHSQNTDVGTTSSTFYLGGATGPRLKSNAGAVEIRNAADSAWADLVVNNLFVRGTQTIIDSNTVNVGDSILTLNSDFTGSSPTENGGLLINRDTAANGSASLIWNETADEWQAGYAGAELAVARKFKRTFTSADLVAGLLTTNHGLNERHVVWAVYDNANRELTPLANAPSASQLVLDFDSLSSSMTGTYTLTVIG